MEQEFIEDNLMLISKPTMDTFLKQDKPADLIALYMFYYYTAKWQKTNQPKATTSYVAMGLHWGEDRVRKTKNKLKDLGLIEDIKNYNNEHKISGWYIKVKYLWGETATQKVNKVIKNNNNHPPKKPQGGITHSVENPETNALSVSSLNALSVNKGNTIYVKQGKLGKKAQTVMKYLNKKTGRNYQKPHKYTTARLREYDIMDLLDVIDFKVSEWGNDDNFNKFLRQSTLFAPSHFDEYLADAKDYILEILYNDYRENVFGKQLDRAIKRGWKTPKPIQITEWKDKYYDKWRKRRIKDILASG